MHLVLTYFDPIIGPRVFHSIPSPAPENIAGIAEKLMNLNIGDRCFEFLAPIGQTHLTIVSLPLEISSPSARGGVETLLLSLVLEESRNNLQTVHLLLQDLQIRLKQEKDLYFAFRPNQNPSKSDQMREFLRTSFELCFRRISEKVEQLTFVDRIFAESPPETEKTAGHVVQAISRVFITTIDARVPEGAAILYDAGSMIARYIAPLFTQGNTGRLLSELGAFWRRFSFGEIDEVTQTSDEISFCVYDCFECKHLPDVGKTICKFDEGLLSTLLTDKLGRPLQARELECFGTGKNHCKFVIQSSK